MKCPKCGLINPDNTQYCDCGYDFIYREEKQKAEKKKRKPDKAVAIVGLLVNLCCWPGVGTVIGGRTVTGIIQMVLFIFSFPLTFIYIGWVGVFVAWVWAVISGILMVREAIAVSDIVNQQRSDLKFRKAEQIKKEPKYTLGDYVKGKKPPGSKGNASP